MIATTVGGERGTPPSRRARDYFSFSAMNLYRSCPLRYRFHYLDSLPEPVVAASLVFGSAVHRAAELHFNRLMAGAPLPTLEELLEAYQAEWQTQQERAVVQFNQGDSLTSLTLLAERLLQTFREHPIAQPEGQVMGVEEEFRGAIIPGVPDLLGRIDLLVETDEAVVISDLKTSRSRWSPEQAETSAEQLWLYSELVKHLIPGKPLRLQFVVLTKTKTPVVDVHQLAVDPQRVERTKRIMERVWQAIEAQNFYPTPSPLNCSSCAFRRPCAAWSG